MHSYLAHHVCIGRARASTQIFSVWVRKLIHRYVGFDALKLVPARDTSRSFTDVMRTDSAANSLDQCQSCDDIDNAISCLARCLRPIVAKTRVTVTTSSRTRP